MADYNLQTTYFRTNPQIEISMEYVVYRCQSLSLLFCTHSLLIRRLAKRPAALERLFYYITLSIIAHFGLSVHPYYSGNVVYVY